MTPAQEAKEYAATHGFSIVSNGRRYDVQRNNGLIANVGGYPAALNAMREHWQYLCDKQDDTPISEPKGMKGCAECTDEAECSWHQVCIRTAKQDPNVVEVPVTLSDEIPATTPFTHQVVLYARRFGRGNRTASFTLDEVAKKFDVSVGALVPQTHFSTVEYDPDALRILVLDTDVRPPGPWCSEIEYLDGETEGGCFATRSEAVTDIRRAMNTRTLRPHIKRVNIRYMPEYVR